MTRIDFYVVEGAAAAHDRVICRVVEKAWQQGHEVRYEQMERARLWRYLSGDDQFDVDYYHTRMEGRTRANNEIAR